MAKNDLEYFMQRERSERDLAAQAADQSVRRVHMDMAERYAVRARQLAAPPESSVA